MYATIFYKDKPPDTNPVGKLSHVQALSYLRMAIYDTENIYRIQLFANNGKLLDTLEDSR